MELETLFFLLAIVTVVLNIICVLFYVRNMNAIKRTGLESTATYKTAKSSGITVPRKNDVLNVSDSRGHAEDTTVLDESEKTVLD